MKKLLTIIASIIIGLLITLLSINLTLKGIITNTMNNMFTADEISQKIVNIIKKNLPELTDYELSEIEVNISKSPELKLITNKYLKTLSSDILNATSSKVDILEEVTKMYDYVSSSMNISEEQKKVLKEKVMAVDYNTFYDQILYNATKGKQTTNEYKKIIEVYNFLISFKLRIILIISIIISTILTCLLNMSILKLLNIFSTSLLISSMILFIMNIIVYKFIPPLTYQKIGKPIDFSIDALVILNAIYFVLGLSLGKIYDLIFKISNKKKKTEE